MSDFINLNILVVSEQEYKPFKARKTEVRSVYEWTSGVRVMMGNTSYGPFKETYDEICSQIDVDHVSTK